MVVYRSGRVVPSVAKLTVENYILTDGKSSFRMELWEPSGQTHYFHSRPVGEVISRIEALESLVGELADFAESWEEYRSADKSTIMMQLMSAAVGASDSLFNGLANSFIDIIKRNNSISGVCVHCQSAGLFVPWNLLAIEVGGAGSWFGEHAMFRPTYSRTCPPNLSEFFSGCDEHQVVGYAEYNKLRSARADPPDPERRDIEEYTVLLDFAGGEDCVELLPALRPGVASTEAVRSVQEWLAQPRRILHFKSHLEQEVSGAGKRYILNLSRDAKIFANMLCPFYSSGLSFVSAVFLNMCNSAGSMYDDNGSLLQRFHSEGVQVVCSTTGKVGDTFARTFAQRVYGKSSAKGMTFYEAVFEARLELLRDLGHPLALLYVHSGEPEFCLRPATSAPAVLWSAKSPTGVASG